MKKEQTKVTKEQEKELFDGAFEIAKLEIELKKAELKAKIKNLEKRGVLFVTVDECEDCPSSETCCACCEEEGNKPSFFGNIFKK